MNWIVSTTVNYPTKATREMCEIAESLGWTFLIVGDLKTPHQAYHDLETLYKFTKYFDPERQERIYPELSHIIDWNCIQRRNVGFVHAYKQGAEIIATWDDDNEPYSSWGKDCIVGQEIKVDIWNHNQCNVFDPLSRFYNDRSINYLSHRGYPLEYTPDKNDIQQYTPQSRKVLIQAALWDGDPDIGALDRLTHKPIVIFPEFDPYGSDQVSPFNSQNTFLHRSVMKHYFCLPGTGRFDDIFGGYYCQHFFPKSLIYTNASVYQDRNSQNLIKNLKDEIWGYENTLQFINHLPDLSNLPEQSQRFIKIYQSYFNE